VKLYKQILVASNLTPESNTVVNRAKAIADKAGATLSIVHVMEVPPMLFAGAEFAVPLDGNLQESLQVQVMAENNLRSQAERVGIDKDHQYLRHGETVNDLLELIQSINVDLLIVGSHQHQGLGVLISSVSNSLLHQMPCDVLAVRV